MRLIDADAFLAEWHGWLHDDGDKRTFSDLVKDAPTIDAVPVLHARWKRCFEDWRQQIEGDECSACGIKHYGSSIDHYHYSPTAARRWTEVNQMAFENGRRYICDRCGVETFCACTGEGELDGGFTRWNKFEPLPDGWKSYCIGLLCTDCNRQYADWLENFMYGGTEE